MAGYYDPNKDYSVAIEQAKAAGQDTTRLEQERANKIADKYGGVEPVMYGTNQTYSSLSSNSGDYITNKNNQNTINAAVSVTQSDASKAAYDAAMQGDWDAAAGYINQMATWDDYHQNYDMKEANDYWHDLTNMLGYNAKEYYDRRYDETYGAGSAATFDATGGAVKTYAELVDKLGAGQAQEMLAQHAAGGQGSSAVPGLSYAEGMSASGGINDMTKYLENLYTQNLEAELAALKSAYDANVAELESQNDKIAEQYRAARNQVAAQNALETQAMNERALATGLNTGTSGQLALAQNMAYQGNLGNLWAQEAQEQAESDRLLAELARDYNAGVNQTTAAINAQRAEAMYNEMIRQEELVRAQRKDAKDYALTMLSNGVMPDAATLSAAGISGNEAQLWYDALSGGTTANTATPAPSPANPAYNNGGLTPSQVKMLQEDINRYLPEGQKIAVDGFWGPATQAAAGGFTAKEYADEYFKQNSWSGRSDR